MLGRPLGWSELSECRRCCSLSKWHFAFESSSSSCLEPAPCADRKQHCWQHFGDALTHACAPAQVPNYTAWVNCLRCGLYAILVWVTALLCALVYNTDGHLDIKSGHYKWDEKNDSERQMYTTVRSPAARRRPAGAARQQCGSRQGCSRRGRRPGRGELTALCAPAAALQAMFAGAVPAFLLGAALAYWRIWYLFRVALKFKNYDPARKFKEYHRWAPGWAHLAGDVCV